jgi:hypothetical protein
MSLTTQDGAPGSDPVTDKWFARGIAVALLGLAVVAARRLGSDANYDLFGYHAYIGEAALSRRWSSDVAAAGLGTFHNPIADTPVALSLRQSVRVLTGWLTIQQWLCWLSVWWFVRTMLRSAGRGLQLVALGFAISGAGAISLSVTAFADWPVAALLLTSVTAFVRSLREDAALDAQRVRRLLIVSGSAGAAAIAVKLTAVVFVVGVVCSLFLARSKARKWLLGFGVAFTVTSAPWWVYLMMRFGSPVFPYFNKLLRAEAGTNNSFDDSRFGARSFVDFFTTPIELARGTQRFSELVLRDPRWTAAVLALVVWGAFGAIGGGPTSAPWARLVPFVAVGYPLWLLLFGIYRYALVLEVIAAVFVVATVHRLAPRLPSATVALALGLLLAFQTAPDWGRNRPLRVALPVQSGDRVLLADMGPSSYLVRSLPTGTRMASLQGFVYALFDTNGPLGDDLRRFAADGIQTETLWVVIDPAVEPPTLLREIGVSPDRASCVGFAGAYSPLAICPGVRAR